MAYLDTDQGAAIRLKMLSATPEERTAMGVVEKVPEQCGPWMREGIDFFYPEKGRYYEDCYEFATEQSTQYKTIVIDTVSRMADGILDQIARTDYGAVKSRVTVRAKDGTPSTVHPVPADFGMAHERILEIFASADHSPAHVLLISHEKTGEIREGEVVKRTVCGPRTVGNALLEVIPTIVDVALRLAIKTELVGGKLTNRVIVRSTNHDIYLAGDRSGLFADGEEFDPALMWERFGRLISMTATPSEVK